MLSINQIPTKSSLELTIKQEPDEPFILENSEQLANNNRQMMIINNPQSNNSNLLNKRYFNLLSHKRLGRPRLGLFRSSKQLPKKKIHQSSSGKHFLNCFIPDDGDDFETENNNITAQRGVESTSAINNGFGSTVNFVKNEPSRFVNVTRKRLLLPWELSKSSSNIKIKFDHIFLIIKKSQNYINKLYN